MKELYSINVAPVFKINVSKVQLLSNFLETKEILERKFDFLYEKYNIKSIMISGKPFFITGKNIAEQEKFNPENSEFYASFDLISYLNTQTYQNNNKSYSCVINEEHLPRTIFDNSNSNEDEYVSYNMSFLTESNDIQENFDKLTIKKDIEKAIKEAFEEILSIKIESIYPVIIFKNHILANEFVLKAIQYSHFSQNKDNAVVRYDSEQILKLNSKDNNTVESTLNLSYAKGKEIFLPCHTQEDFSYNIASLEKRVSSQSFLSKNVDINKYLQLWNINYMESIVAKRTLIEFGYNVFLVRSDYNYLFNGDISEINETPLYGKEEYLKIKEEELEKDNSIGHNIIKFKTGEWKIENLKTMASSMVYTFNKNKIFSNIDNSMIEKTLSIHASIIDNNQKVISTINFYGDIEKEVEEMIKNHLIDFSLLLNIPLDETNILSNFIQEDSYNILFSTKNRV